MLNVLGLRLLSGLALGMLLCMGVGSSLAQGRTKAAGPVLLHDYDPVSDAAVSWRLRPGHSVAQSFETPASGLQMTGFRMKLLRMGKPGDLGFSLLDESGQAKLASGKIAAGKISPFFEGWVGAEFGPAKALRSGRRYTLRLELAGPKTEDYYQVFGTSSERVESKDFSVEFQYVAAWGDTAELRQFENPLNLDYGSRTPVYGGGAAYVDGVETAPLDFAFQILGPGGRQEAGEECFAFIRDLDGPLHSRLMRDRSVREQENELMIGDDWTLLQPAGGSLVVETAIQDFRQFLEREMGVRITLRTRKPGKTSPRQIVLGTPADFPGLNASPDRSEAFVIDSSSRDRVLVCGYDDKGIMRGLHFLEERMRFRRGPVLPATREVRSPLYSPRLTCTPYYAKSELEVPVDPYTDNFLARISHSGFSGIWIWGELTTVGRSNVYPELATGVERRQARLREIADRAAKYGLDIYVYLGSQPLPTHFFEKHPDVKGSPIKAYGGDFVLCTSPEESRRYIREATGDLFRSVPQVKGVVFIVGVEGLLHCYSRGNVQCPRCSTREAQAVVAELSRTVFEGARAANPKAEVAVWPYSASNVWSKSDTLQSKLIARLPAGLTWISEVDKEGDISFGGITIPAYDYTISFIGPSDRSLKQSQLAEQQGLPFWVKTEHAISLEFVQTPYIPVFESWVERYSRLRLFKNVKGFFANWQHYGFMPTIAAEICKWGTWRSSSAEPDLESGRKMLQEIAARDFGRETVTDALQAWHAMSVAFREYPFSAPMALGMIQKGPAHPFFFDPSYRPLQAAGRQFRNDLSWTRPWGPQLALEQLKKVESGWSEGMKHWEKVVEKAEPGSRSAALREKGVAQAALSCLRTAINLGRFYQLREALGKADSPTQTAQLLNQMEVLLRAELENSRQALAFVRLDSRLGYANSGKGEQIGVPRAGIYSPGSILKKIEQVERVLREDIPNYRRQRGAALK